ncbi:AAA family ATPase [Streptomyces achromogenes]|uniref:AAA family ATPase n=1 Tax=Streptomyces achromogenes TaxID=67255 RepID=UPI00099D786B|nr:AAA family ATPase [Streptomyces achromogenes]
MQHAVGSPLPPPHQPGQGPHAGWVPAPSQPAAHRPAPYQSAAHPQGPHPGAPRQPAPVPPPPPGFPATPPGPVPPAPQQPPASHGSPAPQPPVPHPSTAPQRPPAPSGPASAPPAPAPSGHDATGHVPLPPGGPVGTPAAPPAPAPDPSAATLAVLLIGPAGAGKTSVAKYWADHRRVPTAHISLDDVREWVRSGFADPQSGWNENSEAQYRLARRTCGFAARNFLANGISCILDDAVFPDRPVVGLGGWKRHVGPGLLPVVLLPGLDIVLERNAERTGNRRLTDEEVARIHGRMAGWYGSGLPIIDNSQLDIPGTAKVLDEVLARAIASPPSW